MKRKRVGVGSSVVVVLAVFILFILLFSFLFILLFSGFGSAMISGGVPFFNLSQTGFGPGQVIEGKLNFSLDNELGNTLVKATINPGAVTKNATLLDFLKASGAQFTCDPSDCNTSYSVVSGSGAPVKTLNLGPGSEAYVALVASGTNVQVLNLSFSMNGSVGQGALPTCYETPFKFDLLGDGTIDFEYKMPSDSLCGVGRKASECYDASQAIQDAYLELPFCEKIWLNKTGKVQVEGFMKYWGYGYGGGGEPESDDIQFSIYELNGALKGNCSISGWELPQDLSYGYAGCNISSEDNPSFYISKADYYYVCVKKTSTAAYSIKAESQGNVCGFAGVPPQAPTTDFALYVREAAYAPFTEETFFNETTMIGTTPLVMSLQNYLASKYNNNCSGTGCVIPLKFISMSGASQQVTLKDLYFSFKVSGVAYTNNNFYDLSVLWPKLNMTQQEVQLRGLNVTAPQQEGNYYITVMLGSLYGSSTFKVEPVPQVMNVVPLNVIPNQPTVFRASVSAPAGRDIVSYNWNFGDGSGEITTTTPNVSHTYSQGTFTLTVKVQDNLGMVGSRSFTVVSNITKELLNSTIESLLARINSIALQYETVEPWYRDMLDLNLTMINSTLTTFKTQLPTATQSQIASMFETIQEYKAGVPLSIADSLKLTDSPYFANLERINPEYVSDITQESYDSNLEEQYKNAIAIWSEENLNLKLSGQVKTLTYETTTEDKVTVVNIGISPLTSLNDVYLIFLLPSGVSYSDVKIKQGSFETSDLVDAIGFSFSDLSYSETVSIALPGKHDFSLLNFYVSPNLKELDVGARPRVGEEKGAPIGLAIFFIILIVIVVIVVLWFLWHGYSEKLEKKLFRNPMDLYNLASFIANAEAKGKKKEEIIEQLVKAGWSKEQISYAWSKLKKQQKEKERKARGKGKREKEIRPLGATREMPFRSIYR